MNNLKIKKSTLDRKKEEGESFEYNEQTWELLNCEIRELEGDWIVACRITLMLISLDSTSGGFFNPDTDIPPAGSDPEVKTVEFDNRKKITTAYDVALLNWLRS